jgi:hypothetical protein
MPNLVGCGSYDKSISNPFMPGLGPGIHEHLGAGAAASWMAGPSPATNGN